MTYFFLLTISFLALVVVVLMLRVGHLEDRIVLVERDHHALARKGDRLRPTRLWQPLDYEDVDYD